MDTLLGGAEHPKPNCSYKGQIEIMLKMNSLTSLGVKLEPNIVTSRISCVYRGGGVSGTGSYLERPVGQDFNLQHSRKPVKSTVKLQDPQFFLNTAEEKKSMMLFVISKF